MDLVSLRASGTCITYNAQSIAPTHPDACGCYAVDFQLPLRCDGSKDMTRKARAQDPMIDVIGLKRDAGLALRDCDIDSFTNRSTHTVDTILTVTIWSLEHCFILTMFARTLPRALRSTLRTSPHFHPTPLHHKPFPHASLRAQWPTHTHHRPITTRTAARKLWRENPFSVTLATFFILFGASCLVYSNYIYKYFILEQHAAYPEVVAQKLRKAIFYSSVDIQPRNAVKYYKQALLAAQEVGMDAFSDEVLGIKIKLSALMQNIGDVQRAIEVLEIIQRDCGEWMEDLGRGRKGENRERRTSVLKKMVGISVRIGELYADERVGNQEAAEEKLVWAVTTVLRERERREREGVKEGEGEWLSGEEIGAALECKVPFGVARFCVKSLMMVVVRVALGSHYEARNQHFLAAPLFLQAVALIPMNNCHAITLSKILHTLSLLEISTEPTHSEQSLDLPRPSKPSSHRWYALAIIYSSDRLRTYMGEKSPRH